MRDVTVDALQDRQQLVSASRVVVKIGSSSLTGPDGRLAPERLNALVDVLAARRAAGGQVVLVSSGAIAAGLGPLGLAARPRDLATQQAAASVGQGLLVAHYTAAFARYGLQVGQVLLTADDTVRRVHYRNAHRALTRLLDLGDRARHQRERRRGHRRDPVRGQRPPRRPGLAPGARRRAAAAQRRRLALHRPAVARRVPADRVGRRTRRTSRASTSPRGAAPSAPAGW